VFCQIDPTGPPIVWLRSPRCLRSLGLAPSSLSDAPSRGRAAGYRLLTTAYYQDTAPPNPEWHRHESGKAGYSFFSVTAPGVFIEYELTDPTRLSG
jgi:hypothetical protein